MTTASREARCSRHPETAAVELCVRCGSFACIQCVVIRYEGIYCVDCARRVPLVRGSPPAVAAVIMAAVSLVFPPAGVVAILTAVIDLAQIAMGRKWGREKLWLDVLAIVLSLLGMLMFVAFFAYVWAGVPIL